MTTKSSQLTTSCRHCAEASTARDAAMAEVDRLHRENQILRERLERAETALEEITEIDSDTRSTAGELMCQVAVTALDAVRAQIRD